MDRRLHRIGELAAAAGVPTSTVRYYERRRLLPPDARSSARYRLYGQAAIERLRFIRLAQSTGFTLDDIAVLLDARDERAPMRSEVQALLTSRLDAVQRRLSELREVERALKQAVNDCSEGKEASCCPVVRRLAESASEGGGGEEAETSRRQA